MHRKLAWATLATLAGGLLAPVAFAQSPTDVGTLPGFTVSRPKNIDNGRDIVGQVARPGPEEQAALWTRTDDGYSVEALPPLDLSSLPPDAGYAEYRAIADEANALSDRVGARYEAFLSENRSLFAPIRRRGGSRLRVAW